jgi:NAD(P)-dependent dehydrogenase (short-subunit alcohol dehydrogenase family)
MNFTKALAAVSGGASGLGRAVAERVIAEGDRAAILDLQEAVGTQVAKEIGAGFFQVRRIRRVGRHGGAGLALLANSPLFCTVETLVLSSATRPPN